MVVGGGEITRNKSTMRILAICFLFVCFFFYFHASPKFTALWSNSVLFFTKLLVLGLKLDSEVMWFERLTVMRCQMMRAGQSDLGVRLGSETDFLLCLVLFFSWCHHVCLNQYLSVSINKDKIWQQKNMAAFYLTSYFTVHICLKCALIYRSYFPNL